MYQNCCKIRFLFVFLLIPTIIFALPQWRPLPNRKPVKNIILMIPDGTGFASITLARDYLQKPLLLDSLLCGAVMTQSASDFVTDSAAAATAFATQNRTVNYSVGVDIQKKPLASISELAKRKGKAVGIVTTDALYGATPAGFSSHATDRFHSAEIMEQQLAQDFDVLLGGGLNFAIGEKRQDHEDLLERAKTNGYNVATNKNEMQNVKNGKIYGCFSKDHLLPMLSRKSIDCKEPTLTEMTAKALELLAKNENGFFLMIEGAQPDKGNHIGDAAYATEELLEFDRAVALAVNFAKQQEDTIVIVVPDHETGGLTLPKNKMIATRNKRMKDAIRAIPEMLEGLTPNSSDAEFAAAIKAFSNMDLTDSQKKTLRSFLKSGLPVQNAVGKLISSQFLGVEFSTGGHSACDVPLWCYGDSQFKGLMKNTDISNYIVNLLDGDLKKLSSELYVEVENPKMEKSQPANPVLILNDGLRLPAQQKIPSGGVAVFLPETGKWFIPADLLKE